MGPPGLDLFPSLRPPGRTLNFHRLAVLFITFFAYASFHVSRKPPTIVKSVLGPELKHSNSNSSGWAPFDGPRGAPLLGWLDLAFLSTYSVGMYFAGHAGDRIDIRLFLVSGMLGSGFLTILFGLAYWLNIHSFSYFVAVQLACGLLQSIGWPCVITVMGNWFGKEKRGLIMGVWSSNTSIGNVIGSVVASSVLEFGWGWSFVAAAGLIIAAAAFVFFFLAVTPEELGFQSEIEPKQVEMEEKVPPEAESTHLLAVEKPDSVTAIGFLDAWRLPGVFPFSCCLFFSKLVAYTFLYWLPFYIRHTAVAGVHLSHKAAGILSTTFDIGGIFGGMLAGYASDVLEARAITSVIFFVLSVPALICYRVYGGVSMMMNVGLMFASGFLVNGPYALITTAVAADLGTQEALRGNARALATVTAIIDGTGSVGGAIGPVLAGHFSTQGWNSVFFILIVSLLLATVSLLSVARTELRSKLQKIPSTL